MFELRVLLVFQYPLLIVCRIIGLSDGLTVPFALTAGLSSLGSSRLVVTGGLAELCAGAISMGLGGYRESVVFSGPLRALSATRIPFH